MSSPSANAAFQAGLGLLERKTPVAMLLTLHGHDGAFSHVMKDGRPYRSPPDGDGRRNGMT